MGAVQKLATVVIIGLVALATVLTVYIAREPDRRGSESTEQEDVAIVRGTDLYIQYCLQCHGPYGTGRDEPGTERIGAPLNQDASWIETANPNVDFQSDNAAAQEMAEDWLRYRITYGVPADPTNTEKVMPAFGPELNVEEINDLIYTIMYADWDYIYNQAVLQTGIGVAEAECEENDGVGEFCGDPELAPPMYPTVPGPAEVDEPAEDDTAGNEEGSGGQEGNGNGGGNQGSSDAAAEVAAQDPYDWSQSELAVQPGDTIAVVPSDGLQHDFTVDEFGISADLSPSGETVMVTIPEDAEPGDYRFYCSVPGHAEAGMVGTLTIEAPA